MTQKTPLYDAHVKLGARMVPFAGWDMPVQYAGVMAEHDAVRTNAGIFDVSHMGEFEFSGPDALACLQWLTPNDVAKLAVGHGQYSLLCNEKGGVVDDIIIYRLEDTRYLMVVNAANIEKDWKWVQTHQKGNAKVTNRSAEFALLAVQGPKAMGIVQKIASTDLSNLSRFACTWSKLNGAGECLIARTGYTGEDGCEIFVAPDKATGLWNALLDAGKPDGLVPAGLGARDTLRVEMKYPLYGHELTDSTNPIAAGLSWVVKLGKPDDFIGRAPIQKVKDAGREIALVGFEMIDKGIPRDAYAIVSNKKIIGAVTSGTMSPTLKRAIGIGYVPVAFAEVGSKFSIDIRGSERVAHVVSTPFIKK
ncbi:MAG: glycine cleavage system protein T [Deltaproteobacteria bacterium CG11_big_fil_rev_8_21_14_0_20_47_16]|nr:MAG: glycine cleavage system protein T [Deltaproteobacteria bacterium CG11_big_fil_rev_8_21_14_0_20_47_16]